MEICSYVNIYITNNTEQINLYGNMEHDTFRIHFPVKQESNIHKIYDIPIHKKTTIFQRIGKINNVF